MGEITTCRGSKCSAQIRWVRTTAGELMPIDAEPVLGGNVELIDDGTTAVVHGQPDLFADTPRYVSHFATCPNAKEFRRAPQA